MFTTTTQSRKINSKKKVAEVFFEEIGLATMAELYMGGHANSNSLFQPRAADAAHFVAHRRRAKSISENCATPERFANRAAGQLVAGTYDPTPLRTGHQAGDNGHR
jgi:hypothetical protein